MNKKCVALTEDQYKESVSLLRNGFELDGVVIRPNPRIATVCVLQACLGLRLGDVLNLSMDSFIKDGDRWRLDIVEQKTKKLRTFTVPLEVYSFLQNYAYSNGISMKAKLFDVSERQVERMLVKVFTKMNLFVRRYGSHSYRKFFSTKKYMENNFNIELVRVLLQHSSVLVIQRYLNVGTKEIEKALASSSKNLV